MGPNTPALGWFPGFWAHLDSFFSIVALYCLLFILFHEVLVTILMIQAQRRSKLLIHSRDWLFFSLLLRF